MERNDPNAPAGELMVPATTDLAHASGNGVARYDGAPPEEPAATGPDWRRYAAAVLRNKWWILLVTVAGTAAAVFGARYLPLEYQAQSTVWISSNDQSGRGPIRSNELLRSNAWIELLRSYVVLDYVVREERLYLKPKSPGDSLAFAGFLLARSFRPGAYRLSVDGNAGRYTLTTAEGMNIEAGAVGDSIGRQLGFLWRPTAAELRGRRTVDFEVAVPREAAVELNETLRTRIDQNGNFLRLELRMPTGERAAQVLNAIGERYVQVAGDLKRRRMQELTGILEEQLAYAETNLRSSESQLEGFRVSTIVLPSDRTPVTPGLQMTEDPVFSGYFTMKVELEQLRRDREAIERALSARGEGGIATNALEVIPSVQNASELVAALQELTAMQAELRTLRYRYTDDHALVQQTLENVRTLETSTIPRLAATVVEQIRTREAVLTDLIDSTSSEMQSIPPRAIEEARLRRQVAIDENLFTNLRQRHEEARLSVASATPDIQILDAATVPQKPVSEQNAMVILLGFAGSLGLGVLGAILRERIDRTIRYPDQVAAGLGVPVLGAVPYLAKKHGNGRGDSLAEATEAFRSLRLNLMNAHGRGPIVATISSPSPGDGKSFITANLALSFADLGYSTIVIDGDVRKGSVHRLLDRPRVPGLTDYLDGRVPMEEVIQHTAYEHLHVIASGRRNRNSPELLDSRAMRQLLLELRTRYSVILVDSSPLGAGVDPFVLGTITGAFVLVVRTGATRQDFAEAKLSLLSRLPVRTLGAVMNGIDPSQNLYYHYYSYLPGYGAEDETTDTAQQLQKA